MTFDGGMQRGVTVWLTGLSGAGKSTAACWLATAIRQQEIPTILLDGDVLRSGLSADLGFDEASRAESVRRAGEVALLGTAHGFVSIVSLVSPNRGPRELVRKRHESQRMTFMEVYVSTPLVVCEDRDPKDLYARARAGEVTQMTGIHQAYEPPVDPELTLPTHELSIDACGQILLDAVMATISVTA